MKQIILASGSPRRKELLGYLQMPFTVITSSVEEIVEPGITPEEAVMSLARQKAAAVARLHGDAIVIGADTIVVHEGRMLGKPGSREEAAETLRALSGQIHDVYTGVAVLAGGRQTAFYERTEVAFWELTEAEITAYLDTGEPMDKAGSYGIQGKGSVLVKGIHGDYYSVVGLPVARLKRELQYFLE